MEPFEHHVTGRNAYFVVVALIFALVVSGAVLMGAPWWILLIWGLAAIGLIWRYYLNPKSGMSLSGDTWRSYGDGTEQTTALDNIAMVRIVGESESADVVVLELKDGAQITLPEESYPSTDRLSAELEKRGIPFQLG